MASKPSKEKNDKFKNLKKADVTAANIKEFILDYKIQGGLIAQSARIPTKRMASFLKGTESLNDFEINRIISAVETYVKAQE